MTVSPWFAVDWPARYAALLAQIRKLEALAKACGRQIRPRERQ